MPPRLVLAPTRHPPVPHDIVSLKVEVDDSTCGAPIDQNTIDRLNALKQHGFSTPISRIVAYAGIHYYQESQDHWGIGENRAAIQSAWQDICNWNPHQQMDSNNVPRLVVNQRSNSRRQSNFTEVMAVGVGLVVAAHLYQMPLRFWHPTPGLSPYDFRAPATGGKELQLEVRGRFNGNLGNAKAQVRTKFTANATLANQLGAIFCPYTTANKADPDIILLDPESDGTPARASHRDLRALLQHYAPFFAKQNFTVFSDRLLKLAAATDADFDAYLASGDQALQKAAAIRTAFHIGGEEFVGTAWQGPSWPAAFGGVVPGIDFSSGYFYHGIWIEVLQALREGRISEIAEMQTAETMSVDGDRVYIILDDATALAWAPTQDKLLDMP